MAPSGGSWWLHGPFLGGPGRVRPAPAAVGVQPSSPIPRGNFHAQGRLRFFLVIFFFFCIVQSLFWVVLGFFFNYFPSPPFPAPPPLFLFLRAGDFPLYFSFLHIDLKIIKKSLNQFFGGGFGKKIKLKERPQLQPPPSPQRCIS